MNDTKKIQTSEIVSDSRSDDGLIACPVCHHDILARAPEELTCVACGTVFPVDRGIVDFRYVEEKHRQGELRVDDDFIAPDPDALIEKKGAADVLVGRLARQVVELKRQFGYLNLLDVGMFMADGGGMKPFFKSIESEIDLYVGIDPSPHELFTDKVRASNMKLMRSYGEYLPLREDQFNFVVSIASMDHLFDASQCLREIRRVMRPGAVFYTQLNNDGSWFKRLFPASAERRRKIASEWHNYFWTAAQYRTLLREHGFEVLRTTCYRYNPIFDNSRYAAALPRSVQRGLSRLTDEIGDAVLPGLGGNFAITCRLPG
jgi:SAM-dependent methyltransferase